MSLFKLGLLQWCASIQEPFFTPYIPMGGVIPMSRDVCIFMKIRDILSLWVFDARGLMVSVLD